MTNHPLVSVLMTCYNREKYISEAIESVLQSTYTNFELVIVDDCSTDSTFKIAKSYGEKDNRITVYKNERNLGDYVNRNKAASYAKGKYLKYLDSDDIIYSWGLEAMVKCMEKHDEAAFGLMSHGLPQTHCFPIVVGSVEAYRSFFFKGALLHIGPSGAIIRHSAFKEMGGFSGQQYVGDIELWLKILQKHKMVRLPQDLIWWREHEDQQIKGELGNEKNYGKRFMMMRNALLHNQCPLSQEEREMALRNLKNIHVRQIIFEKLLRARIFAALSSLKVSQLTVIDLLKGLSLNKYPKER